MGGIQPNCRQIPEQEGVDNQELIILPLRLFVFLHVWLDENYH